MIYHRFYYIVNDREDLVSRFNQCYTVLRKDHYSFWENCRCDVDNFKMIYSIFSDKCNEVISIELRFVSRDDMPWLSKFSSQTMGFDPNYPKAGMDIFVKKTNEIIGNKELEAVNRKMVDNRDKSSMHPNIWEKYTMNDPFFNFPKPKQPSLTKVISSGPATIAFWDDGSKTVVKCQEDDTYDAEKGILYAVLRKCMSNNKDYHNFLKEVERFKTFVEEMKANEVFWNHGEEPIDESRATSFLNDLEKLYNKYDISISHEDSQGAFILEPYYEENVEWLRAAYRK